MISDKSSEVPDESDEAFDESDEVFDESSEVLDKSDEPFDRSDEVLDKSGETSDKSNEALNKSNEVPDKSNEVLDKSDKLLDKSDRIFNERYLIMGTTAIPTKEDERVTWALNFEDNFPVLGPDLGFSAAEITALVNDSAMMRFAILNSQAAAAFSKTCTAFKNAMLGGVGENVTPPKIPVYNPIAPPTEVDAGVLERLSKAIQRIKLSPNFNQAVAEQLMIATTPPDSTIPADSKPTASGTAITGSIVRIDWTKRQFDGVFIDSQRNEETAWTRLDFDMRSPYEDTRPPTNAGKPEARRYRLIYFIDNQSVGIWSDVITIITLP